MSQNIPSVNDAAVVLDGPRRIGQLPPVSPLAFGCWRLTGGDDETAATVNAAVDLGMNLVDTADVYGLDWGGTAFGACEESLGRLFSRQPGLRDKVVLATKGGIIPGQPYDSSRDYIIAACEASLRRLNTDHVDLYQVHRPDVFTHPDEVFAAFSSLRGRGLVGEVGVSNHTVSQTQLLEARLSFNLASVQPEFSVAHLDPMRDGTLDHCMKKSLVPLAWSPLAGGRVATGEGIRPGLVQVLDELAAREGVTRAAIAVAFVLAHPSRPVAILGTQSPARLAELSRAVSVRLTRADLYRIVEASDGVPLP
ncbi:MAG: aldo/keto reductase family oxidoreductase [Actinomycetota bacterium]